MDIVEAFLAKKNEDVSLSELKDVLVELGRRDAEHEKEREKLQMLEKRAAAMSEELKGISLSNGMMSEDYFYVSLWETKTIGGIHFDIMRRNIGGVVIKDGTRVEGEYDAVLYNDTAVCIVEVKYRVRKDDVLEMVSKKLDSFKKVFPVYDGYDFYLAICGMSFEEDALDTAERLGIGALRLKGDAVEVFDENLKVY